MNKLNSLKDLYIEELKDLYNAETQITKALPKMAAATSSPDLKQAFNTHLMQTQQQINRLEKIFQNMGTSPGGKVCRAMQGLIAEGEELVNEKAPPAVLDAGLISMAQRVEHYEIAGYGCVQTYAKSLGDMEGARLLGETLAEEKATDQKLTMLATGQINARANQMSGAAP